MEQEILDELILGGYSFKEVADMYELPVREIKRIYKDYENS
jgi:hypothetical protein